MSLSKPPLNKKILLMMTLGGVGLVIQLILSSLYPASEYSFTLGVALAIFAIITAIMIVLFGKTKKDFSKI